MEYRERQHRDMLYERARLSFSQDYRELMKEHGLDYRDIGARLGMTVGQVRRAVQSEDISFKDIVSLVWALDGTIRITIVLPRP